MFEMGVGKLSLIYLAVPIDVRALMPNLTCIIDLNIYKKISSVQKASKQTNKQTNKQSSKKKQ